MFQFSLVLRFCYLTRTFNLCHLGGGDRGGRGGGRGGGFGGRGGGGGGARGIFFPSPILRLLSRSRAL